MKIETETTPLMDGRYLVYVAGLAGWCEPKIATWRGVKGSFFHYHSEQPFGTVHGWIGPLPTMEIPKPTEPVQEFDL
jgi:hypothetical protein